MTTKHEQLEALVYKGASNKNIVITDTVLDRIRYELNVIELQGFTDYFILYSRIIEVCNELNLLRSLGRGSAPNSIVNYCLDITKINSIDENLIFERFVIPQQINLPDIDIDIPKGHLDNVIDKLKLKYPEYNTYYIAVTNSRETYYEDIVHNSIVYKKHPSGIIITTENLSNSTFLYGDREYYIVRDMAYDPFYENKIDILELEYLTRLQLIVNEIGEEYHPYRLLLNDPQVYDFIASGNLDNIFQFQGSLLRRIFSQFQPNSIYDLSLISAMYRPSLWDYIPIVTKNKFLNEGRFCPSDIRVSKILEETYGFLIYQESFLHLAKEIAGISFADAEVWRRRINRDRSNTEVMVFRAVFENGCRCHSSLIEVDIASLTNLIIGMLPLTFQKSHALSYAILSYWGVYYKTHFRTQFDNAFKKVL